MTELLLVADNLEVIQYFFQIILDKIPKKLKTREERLGRKWK